MNTNKLALFARLTKIDASKRLVTGIIASETPDSAGEVMDYDKSRANFEAWSASMEKASGGQSKGNVRVMHGLTAAGRLTDIIFHDDVKAIEATAEIVDDAEWGKVQKGVYTGFSIGGSYDGPKWTEGNLKKYKAKPNEVSLVDVPCNPDATFVMLKADGAEETMHFASAADGTTAVEATAPAVVAAPAFSSLDELTKTIVSSALEQTVKDLVIEALAKIAPAASTKVDHERVAKDEHITKVATALAKRAKDGDAKVLSLLGMAELALDSDKLSKSLWDIGCMADCLRQLGYMQDNAKMETEIEGDNSDIPARITGVLIQLGQILVDYVKEEVGEFVMGRVGAPVEETIVVEVDVPVEVLLLAEPIGALRKAVVAGDLATVAPTLDKIEGDLEPLRKAMLDNKLTLADVVERCGPGGCTHAHGGDLAKAQGLIDQTATALRAANAENTELKKTVGSLEAKLGDLQKIAEDAVRNGKRPALRALAKGEDIEHADGVLKKVEAVKEDGGTENKAATLIKAIHANGPTRQAFTGR